MTDGDTVKALTADKRQIKIRLNGIDAPESNQPFGAKSKKWLSDRVFGKDVLLKVDGKDKYGRMLGALFVGGKNVNLESVRQGWSWWYRHYAGTRTDLRDAEAAARKAKRGLWAQPGAMPPWEWRHGGSIRAEFERRKKAGSR